MMTAIVQEIRFALRMLRKHPAYACIAIVTIAMGIGANSAIFNVVNAALIRPLPYENADRLVYVGETNKSQPYPGQLSYTDFEELKRHSRSLEEVAGFGFDGALLTGYGEPVMLHGGRVTESFFRVLGVKPQLGRNFTREEEAGSGAPAVLLTDSLWRSKFNADPQIVGRGLRLGDKVWTVVGVLPANFYFAKLPTAKIFFPLRPQAHEVERRYFHWMSAIGLRKSDVNPDQARADLNAIAASFGAVDPRWHAGSGLAAVDLQRDIVGKYQPILVVLMLAVGFVLLIACANVANLMLARTSGRQKELATRFALGASRGQIARLLLVESTVIAFVGGALGFVCSIFCTDMLVGAIPQQVRDSAPFLNRSSLDIRVVAFAVSLAILCGVLFGILPALRFSRTNVSDAMKSASGTVSNSKNFVYDTLIVGEVALALVLVVAAGLLTLSLNRLLHADPGFDPNGLVTARIFVPPTYRDAAQVKTFQKTVLEQIRNLPGVEGVATTDALPLIGRGGTGSPQAVGHETTLGRDYQVEVREVSSQYFGVMRIPLLSGRPFDERDTEKDTPAAIINRQLAADLFPGQNAIGQHLKFAFTGDTEWEIVGVVGNESVRTLDAPNLPVFYFHYGSDRGLNLVIRTQATAGLDQALRSAVASIDPNVPVEEVSTIQQVLADSPVTFVHRYPAILLSGFGLLALLLALVGIYGVVTYGVARRTREIGIRMALGARTSHVLDAILRRNLVLTTFGLALGTAGVFALERVLQGLLFGIEPTNPAVLLLSIALLGSVALVASFIPARRAVSIDPLVSLREE